ncbi:hypothetical protein GOP47_0026921 [Adiantum capillus-veneris]|nr:hypothetical protein GOP47_0026921 [Adiantum capillus-veneris]
MEIRLEKQKLEEMLMEMGNERLDAQCRLDEEHARCKKLKRELADQRECALAESKRQTSLLRQATEQTATQAALFEREREALKVSHMQEKESWKALHEEQQKDLERRLEEERQKLEKERQNLCSACNEKPRDAVVIPCLHFNYCLECLVRHRTINSNTCPKCNGPIQGLCMSAFGASRQ